MQAFDELHLLKRGGRTIYAGPTGHESAELISYFEAIPGVPPIQPGMNPATWMLEITAFASEERLRVNFAEIWAQSGLAKQVPVSSPTGHTIKEALFDTSPMYTPAALRQSLHML